MTQGNGKDSKLCEKLLAAILTFLNIAAKPAFTILILIFCT